ncbi:MAG: diacylglycerol kinase family lipid kinase [Chloroflexi bacterium]|nr:diacylglycerol kinase family lipid kinase [Chloroflexota bacterium]
MNKPRVKLIINPNADMGNAWRYAANLKHVAEMHGEVDWAGTVYPTHAVELARKAAEEGFDIVVALGGDGTVHEVINGLMQAQTAKRPVLGVVPFGSGNDFSHNIGVPADPAEALEAVFTGAPRRIDLATIKDNHGRTEYWDNTLNMGFGGAVTIHSHKMPLLRGFIMYLAAVLQTIFMSYITLDSEITADDQTWADRLMMIAVNNGPREGGGFVTGPEARLDDGILNLSTVQRVSRGMMLAMLPFFMQGTQDRFKQVKFYTFKKLEIKTQQDLVIHTDGEVFAGFNSGVRHVTIQLLPAALEVMVPKGQ